MVICCVLECIKKSYTAFTDAQLQKTAYWIRLIWTPNVSPGKKDSRDSSATQTSWRLRRTIFVSAQTNKIKFSPWPPAVLLDLFPSERYALCVTGLAWHTDMLTLLNQISGEATITVNEPFAQIETVQWPCFIRRDPLCGVCHGSCRRCVRPWQWT